MILILTLNDFDETSKNIKPFEKPSKRLKSIEKNCRFAGMQIRQSPDSPDCRLTDFGSDFDDFDSDCE